MLRVTLFCIFFTSFGVHAAEPLVVRSDRGGSLEERMVEIEQIRKTDRRVKILGKCYSACTLYLSLNAVCISPRARLGFHAPSTRLEGIPLPYEDFQYWSQRMADSYREPLRTWYLEVARFRKDLLFVDGKTLIRLGYSKC